MPSAPLGAWTRPAGPAYGESCRMGAVAQELGNDDGLVRPADCTGDGFGCPGLGTLGTLRVHFLGL